MKRKRMPGMNEEEANSSMRQNVLMAKKMEPEKWRKGRKKGMRRRR
jgi:hypothetical protein